jgi:hypothetical protein
VITNPLELATQRELTRVFIEQDFEWLTLVPRVQMKTTTGGYVFQEQPPRTPQMFKIIENISLSRTNLRVQAGTQRKEEFTILGKWDALIEVNDIFTLRGTQWEVVDPVWNNGYERRAQAIQYGH